MKKIISYEAYDGLTFNTEEECREYEKDYYNSLIDIAENIYFLDSERKRFSVPSAFDENFSDKFEDLFNKMSYIVLYDDLQDNTYTILNDFFCLNIPKFRGEYRYDDAEDRWIKFTDDLNAFCSKWGMTPTQLINRFTP